MRKERFRKPSLLFIALVAWLALGLQLYVMLTSSSAQEPHGILKALSYYFSYFTILTNLLVALSFTISALMPASRAGGFFSTPSARTAVVVYIVVVGIVYSVALREIWDPRGLQLVADRLLHDATPILCALYWVVFIPKRTLEWKDAFPWLIYPLLYLIYALIRGLTTHWFSYYFIDFTTLGWGSVAVNVLIISAGFLALSFLFILLNRLMKRE